MMDSQKKGVIVLLALLIIISLIGTLAIMTISPSQVMPAAPQEDIQSSGATSTGTITLSVEKPEVATTTGLIILNAIKR